MANNRNTYQQVRNVSINREKLLEISMNKGLSKKDLRVFLMLLTELNGWSRPKSRDQEDPQNFKLIDIKTISKILDMDKKDVKKSIQNLMDADIVEPGDSDTVKNGYRFQF